MSYTRVSKVNNQQTSNHSNKQQMADANAHPHSALWICDDIAPTARIRILGLRPVHMVSLDSRPVR